MSAPDLLVDARGRVCPMPALLTSLALESLSSGDVARVWVDDPTSKSDLPAWCRETGHVIIETTDSPQKLEIRIQKK